MKKINLEAKKKKPQKLDTELFLFVFLVTR